MLALKNREEEVAAVDEEIETELELLGSTAIEDRLQDDVKGTIEFMKDAGIKVWVLTGDKIGTAMNIGVSAGLLDSTMVDVVVREGGEQQISDALVAAKDKFLRAVPG